MTTKKSNNNTYMFDNKYCPRAHLLKRSWAQVRHPSKLLLASSKPLQAVVVARGPPKTQTTKLQHNSRHMMHKDHPDAKITDFWSNIACWWVLIHLLPRHLCTEQSFNLHFSTTTHPIESNHYARSAHFYLHTHTPTRLPPRSNPNIKNRSKSIHIHHSLWKS